MTTNEAQNTIGTTGVLGIEDREQWITLLEQAVTYDFPHTWSYHNLHRDYGKPLLFVYRENDHFVGITFIKRKVPNFDCYDLTSVYGYSGPFSNVPFTELGPAYAERFKNAFQAFLQEEKIVTVFSGLNPFMDQLPLLRALGGIKDNGKTVVIDLRLSLEDQRRQYRRNLMTKLNAGRKRGWKLREGGTAGDIEVFVELYGSAMERLHASARYRFDAAYVARLLSATDFDAHMLFLDDENGYPICATIVIAEGRVLQAFLLATRDEYRYLSPAKVLTEEMTLLGRELGMHYFNLGGGLGFVEDSLYHWKCGFSKLTLDYKTWRYVANEPLYETIISHSGIDPESAADFFPLYRLESTTH
ncbi:MAG: GNAT family N-acetyltransferase [Pedobacter sp.]|uniref:GNAT family N-acetyltransferase n=1 Tax=Pedobacter sp. TaxID=1411316 RepID=UPI003392F0D0